MVYDDRGHFVGDAHWDQDGDLAPGDELTLDRGNAIVQVEDCIGERQQDLTEILDKRAWEVEKRRQIAASKSRRTPASSVAASIPDQGQARTAPAQHRPHISLSNIVQSPGRIGRANIPAHSPYEARQQIMQQGTASSTAAPRPPPAKKRRTSPSPPSKSGFARSLFGAQLNFSHCPPPELLAARARALREKTNVQSQAIAQEEEKESPERAMTVDGSTTLSETFALSWAPRADPVVPKARIGTARGFLKEATSAQGRDEAECQTSRDGEEAAPETTRPKPKKKATVKQKAASKPKTKERQPAEAEQRDITEDEDLRKRRPKKKKAKRTSPPPEEPVVVETAAKAVERRTELRIRTTKRRGLLMMQERNSTPPRDATPVCTVEPVEVDCISSSQPFTRKMSPEAIAEAENPPTQRENTPQPEVANSPPESIVKGTPPEACSEDDRPKIRQRKRRRIGYAEDGDESAEEVERHNSPSPEKPRIARLARKGIKSREIIGYVPPQSEMLVPAPFATATAAAAAAAFASETAVVVKPQTDVKMPDSPIIESIEDMSTSETAGGPNTKDNAEPLIVIVEKSAEPEPLLPEELVAASVPPAPPAPPAPAVSKAEQAGVETERVASVAMLGNTEESTDTTDTTRESENGADDNTTVSRPRIINPATRGRKAARKEDAAGQAPQTFVPFEPVIPGARISTRPVVVVKDTASASLAPRRIASVGGSGATKQLAGFTKASGGTWSEHAQDLLGMRRPE